MKLTRRKSILPVVVAFIACFICQQVSAQVFDSGPSDPSLFDTVINLPPAPDIGSRQSIGGDGLFTQLNIGVGGFVGSFFDANSGSEVNGLILFGRRRKSR